MKFKPTEIGHFPQGNLSVSPEANLETAWAKSKQSQGPIPPSVYPHHVRNKKMYIFQNFFFLSKIPTFTLASIDLASGDEGGSRNVNRTLNSSVIISESC